MNLPILIAQAAQTGPVNLTSTAAVKDALTQAKEWLLAKGPGMALNLLVALLILILGRMLANGVNAMIVRLLGNRKIDQTASRFIANIASILIMVLVVITALGQLGIPTTQFAAVIAAAGLAIGLALQNNLSNFAAGFMIVFFRPFKKGDYISGGGVEGVVEEVQVFSTLITTGDNKLIIVPNSKLTSDNITNFTANSTRRVDLTFIAGNQNEPAKVEQALLSAAQANSKVLKKPAPAAVLKDVTGKLTFELRAWCKVEDYWEVYFALNEAVNRQLPAQGIGGPISVQLVKMVEK